MQVHDREGSEMKRFRDGASIAGILALALATQAAFGQEQSTPTLSKQVRIVVASVGGTGPDFIARLLAPKLAEAIKQSVVIDNRPSANGIAAAQYAARAPADGSTLMMGNAGTHAINAALYRKLDYDPVKDFAAITEIASVPLALVVHPSVPARSVKELVALARKSPGKLNIAIAGAAGELMGNALKLQAGVTMTNIPYKGGAQAATAVIAGEADMVLTTYVVIGAHVESGRLRVLGVTSPQRMTQLPNVPTIAEGGLPGYEGEQWYALFAPARTPGPVIDLLNKEIVRIVGTPEVTERLLATGHRIVAGSAQSLADKVRREVEKTRKIMLASGMAQQ